MLFLYGPMSAIYILSFQGPNGGLTFPLNGVSLNWFRALFEQQRTGDIAGSFVRSIALALIVLALTVVDLGDGGPRVSPPVLRRRPSSSTWRSPA